MSFSVEVSITPAAEIARKILNNVDEILDVYFAKKKTLDEIGWCSSYMLDKGIFELRYLIEFLWLNISPNHKLCKKQGENFQFLPFFYVIVFTVNQCYSIFREG